MAAGSESASDRAWQRGAGSRPHSPMVSCGMVGVPAWAAMRAGLSRDEHATRQNESEHRRPGQCCLLPFHLLCLTSQEVLSGASAQHAMVLCRQALLAVGLQWRDKGPTLLARERRLAGMATMKLEIF